MAGAHLDVISGLQLQIMLPAGPPVCRDSAVKSPVLPQDAGQKLPVFRSMHSVQKVVGGHDRPGLFPLHDQLKGAQIDLPKRSLAHAGIASSPVCLLVVDAEMLHACADSLRLNAPHHGSRAQARKQRIL